MQCSRCRNPAILFQAYSGRHLCDRHLVRDIESRAKHVVRSHHGMHSGDHIAVILDGGVTSTALLLFMKKLIGSRKDIRLSAMIAPDGDASLMRNRDAAEAIAQALGVPVLDPADPNTAPSRITVAASLDDVAQEVLREFLHGDVGRIITPPPGTWNGIPVLCPFMTIPSAEIARYGEAEGITAGIPAGFASGTEPGRDEEYIPPEFSRRHPATNHAILRLAGDLSSGRDEALAAGAWLKTHPGGAR